jgi:hypothetical protein
MSELGPISKALLDIVNETFGFITPQKATLEAANKTDAWHSNEWWFRRLAALALEGRIEGHVFRKDDKVTINFRRRQEAEGP